MNKKILAAIAVAALLCSCKPIYRLLKLAPSEKLKTLSYTNDQANPDYRFDFPNPETSAYLAKLRLDYRLDSVVGNAGSELAKIKAILDWTHRQWQHNGSNRPSRADALTILKEAREGKQFRCVEYGIVASEALNAVGQKARVIGLKTRDVEKVKYGAGHVTAEVYSVEAGKWIYIDPQFNVMPVLNGIPLNAVEFQQAIVSQQANLKLENADGEVPAAETKQYLKWVAKYLFYFDVQFDQRVKDEQPATSRGSMIKITLVPVGEKEPRLFERTGKIKNSYYSHSLNDFYRKPE